ncbi:16S rRNA (guanine(527)-N(7))-methyltransferase RsmG [Atopobacter sp. AH10]|uniref:16S rRNA (guanine(527)-N(7))-methyltransferase RsmG n=1 Tax=Atopobacter sp. AH10 TaxID=2315861 RepID=UPI000EF1BC46|nr:16S rRNA (guanine(527)-N(7))-methyltransferase RsmG [Atopobacter sp. AH10]RLK62667.1 16S rRNA (guanine(527)-N(7))-methyltransferase RsmG [Atopobacter sp. AH10]
MTPETFKEAVKARYGIDLSSKQMEQFHVYYQELVQWNQQMNLTAITEEEGVYEKHFFDSLSLIKGVDLKNTQRMCDVGSGAGFPSLPVKIVFPNVEVTIVDALKKRISFLEALCDKLGLEGVNLVHDRAEIFGQDKKYREQFDLVTARAVARLNVLTELCLPLCQVSGTFVAMKGSKGQEELEEAKKAIRLLGGETVTCLNFQLPTEESQRDLIVIKKMKQTPKKYPRQAGKPNKSPIR